MAKHLSVTIQDAVEIWNELAALWVDDRRIITMGSAPVLSLTKEGVYWMQYYPSGEDVYFSPETTCKISLREYRGEIESLQDRQAKVLAFRAKITGEVLGKPCVLILKNEKANYFRVFTFDDHIQAMDIADHFAKAGYEWSVYSFEHIARGDTPANMPIVQLDLFGKKDS